VSKYLHEFSKKYDHIIAYAVNSAFDLDSSIKLTLNILDDVRRLLKDDILYVMFSGGKDSLVLLDLTLKIFPREQVKVIFIEVTGNTHEKNIEYVRKIIREYYELPKYSFIHIRYKRDFYDTVVKWGWPGPRRKWCMNVFKRNILNKFFREKHIERPIALVGTKVKDSKRRLKRFLAKGILLDSYWWNYAIRPLAHFTTAQIREYIRYNNLPLCSLYHELGESGNCVYCPFIMKRSYYLSLYKLYPKWIYKIIETELKVRKGTPFIISPKKIGFRNILGNEIYNQILKNFSLRM